ncbi:MAG: NADP-dependent glyceraldehyde-3-phosphate dehydrogenase [Acidobacteriia bacterium]|nr:NADP-dependent glyceraldehyde-3-phosphate dehydrogenase [Terriglobia bacterium]
MNPEPKLSFPSLDGLPAEVRLPAPVDQREYLIGGEIRRWDGPSQEVLSPICRETPAGPVQHVIGSFPLFGEKETLAALDAAVAAYDNGRGAWPTMSVPARIAAMEGFVHRMIDRRAEIVLLLMWEIGKARSDSEKEFDRTVDYIRDTIDALKDLDRASSRFVIEQGIIAQIRRAPLGVVLSAGPFNYPLNETFTTLIPALIMGNTVVFKPPRLGVLLHRPLLEAFRDSFPPGVVNTVYGSGRQTMGPLMASGKINVLAFIGTSPAADALRKQHPQPHRLRCVLGLEAKNPAIILGDADLDLAVRECVMGALSFNGQRCTALKILFVHRPVANEFLDRLCRAVNSLKAGMPWDDGVGVTPLPEPGKPEKLRAMVDDAVRLGGRIVNDGGGASRGTFFLPAVVYPTSPDSRLYREEQFGPVVPVVPFEDIEDPIRYVAESNYGQQLSIFGSDPDAIAHLIDPLVNQVCRLNINSQCQRGPDKFPFTGRKDSAEGTLSVSDALRVFTIRTLVAAKANDINKRIITKTVRDHTSNFLSTDFIL